MKKVLQRLRCSLVWLVWLGLVGRVLVPPGFMPGSLEDGVPIKVCPGRTVGARAGAAFAHLHGGPGDDPGESHQEEGDERGPPCPDGALFALALLLSSSSSLASDLPALDALARPSRPDSLPQTIRNRPRPRGPPAYS